MFDNVERYEDLRPCIPKSGCGAYVVTSRDPDVAYSLSASSLRICSFEPKEGGAFLVSHVTGELEGSHNTEKAIELSAYLGGLPLGLKQIGGFIRETGCSMDDLLKTLQDKEQEKEILDDPDGKVGLDYEHNLATAWAHSLTALSETARCILLFFSLLDPDYTAETIVNSFKDSCSRHLFPEVFPLGLTPIR